MRKRVRVPPAGQGGRMTVAPELPTALAALAEVAAGLLRRAPSARIALVRAGGLVDLEALPPALGDRVRAEIEAARAATCVPLRATEVERILRAAWGEPPGRVLEDLDPEPLAVTPAGQVHRGVHDGAPVAVKVLRPGVEAAVRADLVLLDALAGPLAAAFPGVDARAVLRDAREAALDELDLEHEAGQQRRLARSLRPVAGVAVPRPVMDLCRADVLVAGYLEGETLAAGARPADPGAAARALVAAVGTAVLDAGLAPVDLRPSHVVVAPGGELGLLGLGTARPVSRERARELLAGLHALRDGDRDAFARAAEHAGVLPATVAGTAYEEVRTALGELVAGPATLDPAALRAASERAARVASALARIGAAASPAPEDLALARALGQLAAVLARLGAREDWVNLLPR
jgi:ABC1 family protein